MNRTVEIDAGHSANKNSLQYASTSASTEANREGRQRENMIYSAESSRKKMKMETGSLCHVPAVESSRAPQGLNGRVEFGTKKEKATTPKSGRAVLKRENTAGSDLSVESCDPEVSKLTTPKKERRTTRTSLVSRQMSQPDVELPEAGTVEAIMYATKTNPCDDNYIQQHGEFLIPRLHEDDGGADKEITLIEKETKLSDFLIGKYLGSGKFGVIHMVKHRDTGCIFALKTLWKHKLRKYNQEPQVKREISVHLRLLHQNILRMYTWFQDEERVFLVLEYAPGGELYHILNQKRKFSELRAAWYISQIVEALTYCHKRNVLHRDLKPENILVGLDRELKLADFGWSALLEKDGRNTLCGTLDYLPPEMLNKQTHDTRCDLWALGILAYEFLEGRAPFETQCTQETYKNIKTATPSFKTPCTDDAKDFVNRLLMKLPQDRMNLHEVRQHRFVQTALSNKAYCESMYGGKFHVFRLWCRVKLPKWNQYAQRDDDDEIAAEDSIESVRKKVKSLPLERF